MWPGGHRVVGQVGSDEGEVERERPAELGGTLDRAGIAGEAPGLLRAAAQVGGRRRRATNRRCRRASAGRAPRPARWPAAGAPAGVVHVVGGDDVDTGARGQRGQRVVAGRVERIAVVPQLDGDVVAPEDVDQRVQLALRGSRPARDERGRHRALAATGEHLPVAAVQARPAPRAR